MWFEDYIKTEIEEPFVYRIWPILLCLIVAITLGIFYHKFFRTKNLKAVVVMPNRLELSKIKRGYLLSLKGLLDKVQSGKMSTREAYQNLSSLIRNFCFETTHVRVQNYTLTEIEKLNILPLTELVREYYGPEFAKESKGDILASIKRTEEVIRKWTT